MGAWSWKPWAAVLWATLLVVLPAHTSQILGEPPSRGSRRAKAKASVARPIVGGATIPASSAVGRLPTYYAKLVTEAQRQKIYAIQRKHQGKIEAIQARLEKAIQSRDAEIEAVLTREQKKRLAALVAKAKAQREKKAASQKPQPAHRRQAQPHPRVQRPE